MLPFLSGSQSRTQKYTVAFRGLNWGEDWADGELSQCRNLSARRFPCLTQSHPRSTEGVYPQPEALFAKDGLFLIAGGQAWYRGAVVGQVSGERKQLASLGRYILIFPDKVFFDTESGEWGTMEPTCTAQGISFTDASITVPGLSELPFRVGDGVTISGCAVHGENNRTAILRGVSGNTLTFYENTFTAGTEEGGVTLKRVVPDLDFVCESGSRLWGVHGGTIYGSKYGDPFNFQAFDGLTGDSYYIDVASDGPFTGCIPYSSHICFFKENVLHKLYGSKPSNFQLVTSRVCGVQPGCERSLQVINETLYYKGTAGVYAYTGGVPELVSAAFGDRRFSSACAAADGARYCLSMKRGEEWGVYVYDTARDLWLQEDGEGCADMACWEGSLWLLGLDGALRRVDQGGDPSGVEWSATFRPFYETVKERKGYSRFHLRLDLAAGAWLRVEVKRDTDAAWQTVYTTHGGRQRTVSVPILPARCDSLELRLSGRGECLVRTLVREFFVGSDT